MDRCASLVAMTLVLAVITAINVLTSPASVTVCTESAQSLTEHMPYVECPAGGRITVYNEPNGTVVAACFCPPEGNRWREAR